MVLIDTNIILDLVFSRKNHELAAAFFEKASEIGERAYISASTVTDLFYIIRKETHDKERTYHVMSKVFKLVGVLAVTKEDIEEAFGRRWKDFEDCVQYTVAKNNKVQYILTSNKKDYEDTEVSVLTPEEYLELF